MHNHTVISKRPADIAINIQYSHSTSRPSIGGPRSPSLLSMCSFSFSEIDYAKRVATQNNINIKINKFSYIHETKDTDPSYNFNMPTFSIPNHRYMM